MEATLSIPELRGMSPDRRPNGERPYSPESYAAQYGITVEDATDLIANGKSHGEVKRQIYRMFTNDPELRQKALEPANDELPMSAEEKDRYARLVHRVLKGKGDWSDVL